MLEFEFADPDISECESCGATPVSLTRFVTNNGEERAVCYLSFSCCQSERVVHAAISIGPWWDGTDPSDRVAFALQVRSGVENFEVSVRDKVESPWIDVEMLGQMLNRKEALAHPLCSEAFHITDHLFSEDEALRQLLDE